MFILGPDDPFELARMIGSQPQGREILDGVRGFYATDFRRLFPTNQDITQEYERLCEQLLGAP